MMPETELGRYAIAGYSRYLGVCATDLVQSMEAPPTPSDIAAAIMELLKNPKGSKGNVFLVSGKGIEAMPPGQGVEEELRRHRNDRHGGL
jgi:hypothetical protein